jgi:glycosyltransferase involved in cell wall biosynthesis
MNVLFLAPQPFYAERGTPIAVRMTGEAIGRMGHEVDLLVYHEGEEIEMNGVKIIRISPPPGIRNVPVGPSWKKIICDLWFTLKLLGLMRVKRYDVIHAVEESAFIAYLLRGIHRLPYVMDMDSSISSQLEETYPWIRSALMPVRLLERQTIRRAAATLAVSEKLAQLARETRPDGPVHVVEDASLLEPLPKNEDRESHRDTFSIAPDVPVVVYVGNLNKYQGVDLLLEAFSKIKRPAALVVVGGDMNSVERYSDKARLLGLDNIVHWAGSRPLRELSWHLEQADILVSPRIHGVNTPMKIYSYLASGVPILATDILSHSQVLTSEVAMLVDPDSDAMAEGLDRLLEDESLRVRIGSKAKVLAEENYSREVFERKVAEFYLELEDIVCGHNREDVS